jgi:flagellar basal-body rod protein FlgF
METTSIIAMTRQDTLGRQLDVLANNLSNMNTSGFKGEKVMFIEHLTRSRGGEKILGEKFTYVRDIATLRDTSEGPIAETGNPLDVAIAGEGYFAVRTDVGEQYTRNGHFRLDEAGQLVTQNGDPVLSNNDQPFFFGPEDTAITISLDGTVSTNNGALGKMRIITVDNQQKMRQVGSSLFAADTEVKDVENPTVVQNSLESSNIQPILEMSRLIDTQRAYDSVRKFIDREDERMRGMIRDLMRPA